jgi:hypothetical protein
MDEQLRQDDRIEELETQEFTQPANLGGYALIEEITPAGVSSGTFSSIPNTYRQLRCFWKAKSDALINESTLEVQFNGDTSSIYRYTNHQVAGPSSPVHNTQSSGLVDSIQIGQITADGASVSDEEFGHGFFDISYYKDTDNFKMLFATSGGYMVSRDGMRHSLHDGQWEDASAITSIKISIVSADDFLSGTKFSLYGLA